MGKELPIVGRVVSISLNGGEVQLRRGFRDDPSHLSKPYVIRWAWASSAK